FRPRVSLFPAAYCAAQRRLEHNSSAPKRPWLRKRLFCLSIEVAARHRPCQLAPPERHCARRPCTRDSLTVLSVQGYLRLPRSAPLRHRGENRRANRFPLPLSLSDPSFPTPRG